MTRTRLQMGFLSRRIVEQGNASTSEGGVLGARHRIRRRHWQTLQLPRWITLLFSLYICLHVLRASVATLLVFVRFFILLACCVVTASADAEPALPLRNPGSVPEVERWLVGGVRTPAQWRVPGARYAWRSGAASTLQPVLLCPPYWETAGKRIHNTCECVMFVFYVEAGGRRERVG